MNFNLSKSIFSGLIKSSLIYTLASFINASIPFILLPILTSHLSTEDYGLLTMFTTLYGFLMPFIGVNMEAAIQKRYYDNKNNIASYIGNCLAISSFFMIFVIVITYFLKSVIFNLTGLNYYWVLCCIIYCYSQFVILTLLVLLQVSEKPFYYGFTQIFHSLINFVLTIIFVVFYLMEFEGRIFGILLSSIFISILSLSILIFNFRINFRINYQYVRHAVKMGSGLIPHALGFSLIMLTNRFFIVEFFSVSDVGIYYTAVQICSVISLLTFSINNAFVPWLFANLSKNINSIKQKIIKFTYMYYLFLIVTSLIFLFVVPLIYNIAIDSNYHSSIVYVKFILLAFIFQGMYYTVTNYLIFCEKTHIQGIITFTIGLFNIPITYFMMKYFGLIGAAYPFAVTYILMFVFTWSAAYYYFKMPWFKIKFS